MSLSFKPKGPIKINGALLLQAEKFNEPVNYSNMVRQQRKSGYYWVVWSFNGDPTGRVLERIGYYNGCLGTWVLPGEERHYVDGQLLSIDERPIPRRYAMPRWERLLQLLGGLALLYFSIREIIKLTT